MAIHHASSGELIDILPLKGKLKTTPTKTLFKSNHLEVSRTVLLAGKDVPPHQVAGEMTVAVGHSVWVLPPPDWLSVPATPLFWLAVMAQTGLQF